MGGIEYKKYMETLARKMETCPKCGQKKGTGGIVCWGECWRGENGLKYTQLETEQWLKENCQAGAFKGVNR